MDELKQKDKFDVPNHTFCSYDWDSSNDWQDRLATKLVPIIRKLYLDYEGLKKNVKESEFDDVQIKQFIDTALKANIPGEDTDAGPSNFGIRRADFAEILALLCLEELYKTEIPAKNIFHRELTHVSGRGIDILGYEIVGNALSLVICEVKGSASTSSPPEVVGKGDDSLCQQLYSYMSDKRKTLNRILNIHKKARNHHKLILSRIALLWSKEDIAPLNVVICPFLVRQANTYSDKDFGCIKDQPDRFLPAKVRFLIICVHEDLVKLSKLVYEKARDVKNE